MEVNPVESQRPTTPQAPINPLDRIMLSLEGSVVLEKPRVSRDVIIEVLREHTEIIRELQYVIRYHKSIIMLSRFEIKSAKDHIYAQSEELESARKQKEALGEEIKRNRAEINSLRKANMKVNDDIKDIRQDLGITQVKIASLGNIMELEQVQHLRLLSLDNSRIDYSSTFLRLSRF